MIGLLITLGILVFFAMSDWYNSWGYVVLAPVGWGLMMMYGWHWFPEPVTLGYAMDLAALGGMIYGCFVAFAIGITRMCRDIDRCEPRLSARIDRWLTSPTP